MAQDVQKLERYFRQHRKLAYALIIIVVLMVAGTIVLSLKIQNHQAYVTTPEAHDQTVNSTLQTLNVGELKKHLTKKEKKCIVSTLGKKVAKRIFLDLKDSDKIGKKTLDKIASCLPGDISGGNNNPKGNGGGSKGKIALTPPPYNGRISPSLFLAEPPAQSNGFAAYAQPLEFGAQINSYEITTACQFAPKMGVHATTVWTDWGSLEPQPETFTFSGLDSKLSQLSSCGVTDIGLHIMLKNNWGTTEPGIESPPADPNKLYTALTAIAAHYKSLNLPNGGRVTRFALGNEYESANHWPSSISSYTSLLQGAYQAVKAGDPQAQPEESGTGGSCFGVAVGNQLLQSGYDQEAIDYVNSYYGVRPAFNYAGQITYISQLQNFLLNADAKSRFACRFNTWFSSLYSVNLGYSTSQIHYYAPWDDLTTVFHFVRNGLQLGGKPASFPIEVWELGYGWPDRTTYNQQNHSQTVVKLLATAAGEGADRIIYWKLLDEMFKHQGSGGTSPSRDVGLVQEDQAGNYAMDPPATAYQVTVSKLSGATGAKSVDTGNPSVWVYGFNFSDGHTVYVAWTADNAASDTISLPIATSTVSVTDITGAVSQANPSSIPVGPSPVFIQ
ncbi:hypothetical protein M1271_02420 [Patescibacteria group bacterium]|nr:hypothetical protein [Patescibacteria group bacterium]